MIKVLLQDNSKPDQIIEIEKVYGITLIQTSIEFSHTNILPKFTYSLNSNKEVNGLSISDFSLIDISIIEILPHLEYIDLSGNLIVNIEVFNSLYKLKYVYLRENKITDIRPLLNSPGILSLYIWKNPIKNISLIKGLKKLQRLSCWRVRTNDMSFVSELHELKWIDSSINSISNLNEFITSKSLNQVLLEYNNIRDTTPLLSVSPEVSYNLNGNHIKFISKEVAEKYAWLESSHSRLTIVPNTLIISNNPLEFPPLSVIGLGGDVTKNYYETSEQFGHAPLSEGRIIVVGDGSSGKSSLIEKVINNTFTLGREQTNGIKIDNLYLQHPEDNRNLAFHIWDFGGQEIQHAVHKFFFTEGCLYVLVLDNRKEEEPEYWLQQIESLGGKAPVLVVFNKQDQNAAETADRKFLKEKYPNIVGFYNTSCKTGFGIEDFKKSLETEVVKLRTVSEQFPNNWLAVKKAIEEHTSGSQHYLTYEAYQEICKQNYLITEQAQKLLLKYFNTIGTVTWFGEDVHLQFMHVLNPAWITQGVYKILTAKKTANLFGQIEVKDFKELLQPVNKEDYTYDEKHYGYILSMMKKFDLCYSPDDKRLLIPSAFGKVPKIEYSDFRGESVRVYILQFKDYMPMALIHRFTAQKMPDVIDSNYWYTGIVIKDNKSDSVAMVHADREAKRIYIRIKGESKLGLWEHTRRDFTAIASSYARIPYDELLALEEKTGSVVNYDDLVSHVKAQKYIYFHPKLQKDFNVGYLMGLFEPKENTTDKIAKGEIILNERESNIGPAKIPPFVLNILNNNNPVVNTQINTQVNIDIDIQLVNEKGSSLKGDADYLLEALGDSNKELSEALQKIMLFADDVKAARNSGDVKEKGWGRKLKNVLDTLGSAGENIKNIQDGGEVVKSILSGIKDLAHHFNLNAISSWFS